MFQESYFRETFSNVFFRKSKVEKSGRLLEKQGHSIWTLFEQHPKVPDRVKFNHYGF